MSEEVLSAQKDRALSAVLDAIIPPSRDGRLPGAGAAGLAPALWRRLADQRPAVAAGLEAADAAARARGASDFAALDAEAREAVLNETAPSQPAFLGAVVFHSYATYYQTPRVLEGLGVPGRAPHPEGYPLETGDLELLDAVRSRAKLYREP